MRKKILSLLVLLVFLVVSLPVYSQSQSRYYVTEEQLEALVNESIAQKEAAKQQQKQQEELSEESKAEKEDTKKQQKQLDELNNQLKEALPSSKKSEVKKYVTTVAIAVSFFCIGYVTNEFRSK